MPKILIVDDDPVIRNLLEQILEPFEEHGVELLTADNGVAALEVVRSARPEVIFLDVMMPRMNGFEVCKIVKNDPDIANCYVVMLTAKGQEVDKQKAKEIGVDCYITKPFNITELVGKVSEVMGIKIKWGS
ncbi:MAG TPA: response regulator [Thermodesulfovibrionales bacterium]|nr:response regulator [Thermodesulfovibrionales bacterium]